ncbi:malonyl-coenzyme:anthocyanin 5-O-glucoside-6'''-O-malonyltransferase-like [Salvia hispanica]|uniref:malonyl-coenzyme:anthocyanin 5-O-glucoside-6'''-O-malonyltransferase-like n=1 Tax=Salvia hispanica TaxID=49212 RepID=UPI0020096FD4|nr:malonyl-coenzyme:anthocyanin 5-O-glucoside-6'''-O-malonyltransferase-like [Salvia hispanica]
MKQWLDSNESVENGISYICGMGIKSIEVYSVSPCAGEQKLPLVYFDIIWLLRRPTETIYFHALRCSQSHFLETIVPNLKHSLSEALQHFLPLASNIIFPLTSTEMPVSHYSSDSLPFTIAISDADFDSLTANHSKDAHQFHQFAPQMPPPVYSSAHIKFKPLAIQVSLFEKKGICIGLTHHHAICDAVGLFAFLRTWASIHKSGDPVLDSLPFYDRDSVQDSDKLTKFSWNSIRTNTPTTFHPSATHKVRATFILTVEQINKLKCLSTSPISTFVATCAHLWTCLARSETEAVDDDEPEYLTSPMDCRRRLNPPLPDNYFGNCLIFLQAKSSHRRLRGEEGFVAAAEAVAAAVREAAGGGGVLEGFEAKFDSYLELKGKRVTTVAGSSRIDRYGGVDYGWGKAIKYECIHTDFDGSVTLCMGRNGGIEMGLSLTTSKMDAFAAVFDTNLL